jgi:pSer/pThr/pTyr-binding forkhead associated (FHA) protein
MVGGGVAGSAYRLAPGANLIAREQAVAGVHSIVLAGQGGAAATVSSEHARIVWDRGKVTVTDLNSTNGTLVNGKDLRADQAEDICPGDVVQFGTLKFRLTS